MKKYILALALALCTSSFSSMAQAPRIRTSAPPEKTARQDAAGGAQAPAPRQNARPAAGANNGRTQKPKASRTAGSGRFMALKTNVAYDAIAVLNLDYELQVGRRFTVDVPVMWSLWDCSHDLGLRIVAVQPEVRYWFGRPGKGSAVGVNLGIASYNFRHDDVRYQNVSGRPLASVAAAYTYVLPIDAHWSAEFSLAVGYANTRLNRYYNIDNGALINTKTRNYFGPTRIGISLSYRLGK